MIEKIHTTKQGAIHYWVSAPVDSDAPALIFLPGLTADHRLFDKQIEHFEHKHTVFVCIRNLIRGDYMKIEDEIRIYCQEIEPVGALLLTGEWGCGKTYFINHTLKDKLSNEAVLLRISLFGITKPEEVQKAIRQAWVRAWLEETGNTNFSEAMETGRSWLNKLSDIFPDNLQKIVRADVTEFIPLKNKMNGKSVILIFDDLERCQMDTADVLGIINDYCENERYHTIIVANQEKIEKNQLDKANKLSYDEIKEKIIQRTINYVPNYQEIVKSVIDEMKYSDESYEEFVKSCETDLLDVFAPDRDVFEWMGDSDKNSQKYPHNIRSLKCALNDFYRVYNLIQSKELEDIKNYFCAFIAYMLAYKANIVKESVLFDAQIQKIFPAFQAKYMLNGVKEWIIHGTWNEARIEAELDFLKEKQCANKPWEIIKSNKIMDVDDDILKIGFSKFLNYAYAGKLTLDEYVLLISNSRFAREYNYELPEEIEWEKIESGIHRQIEKIKQECPEGEISSSIICENDKKNFTQEEWKAYQMISQFSCRDEWMFFKNRKMYIEEMQKTVTSGFFNVQNRRFDCFNKEMADATAQAFVKARNMQKNQIMSQFINIWNLNLSSPDTNFEKTKEGLLALKELLKKSLQHSQNKKTFSEIHTERFIVDIDGLVGKINEELAKNVQSI